MNSDLSEDSSQDQKPPTSRFQEGGNELKATSSKPFLNFCFEKPESNCAGGESSGMARNANGRTDRGEPFDQKKRKESQTRNKLSKSIQNNIDMYFKRDFTKLRTAKEQQSNGKKCQGEKKTAVAGPVGNEKTFNKQQTMNHQRDQLSMSISLAGRGTDSPSKTCRGPSSNDLRIDKYGFLLN